MAEIEYANVNDLYLDPFNPRLGRGNTGPEVSQQQVLDVIKDWTLGELACSFLENGFWPQEALIVVEEELYGERKKVVVEGNRRLAALMYLKDAKDGEPLSRKWRDLVEETPPSRELFDRVPYIRVEDRGQLKMFLGFRHVTGIKEWHPTEKAQYISALVDSGLTYAEVMRKIGSKTETVRRNYIAYRLFLQMEELGDAISLQKIEKKFSVLFLALRTVGVQEFLNIEINATREQAQRPVSNDHLDNLTKFAKWLFGTEELEPIVRESRQVEAFASVLKSKDAIDYLSRTDRPVFETAYRIAGGDEIEVIKLVENAADDVETALSRAHLYPESADLGRAVLRLAQDSKRIVSIFPDVWNEVFGKAE